MSLKPLQLQFADLPRKPPQPGVLKKSPQPEFPHLANKPVQAEFPKKPLHPEFTGLKKPSQAEFTDLKKPPQPQFASLPKKPPKPEFGELSKRPPQLETPQEPSAPPAQKLLKPEPNNPARPLGELKPKMFWHLEANEAPKRPLPSESSTFPKKPLQPEAVVGFSRKSQPQSESIEVSQTSPSKCGSRELDSHSPQPDISTFPKNNENFRKPSYPQATGCPKSPKQPMFYEFPQTPPRKPESCNPQSHSPLPDFNAFPKKHPQLQPSDLTRASSEPEVCKVPKKTQKPDPNVLSQKPSQPELGHLPRTSSDPEFNSLPRKFLQPQHGKFFQPEFPKGLPRKPKLPGSVSECSLPSASAGSSPQCPLSPGLIVPGIPRWRSEDFQVQRPPRRRPLPSASSLGHPPAKPALPPGPINIQSFRRAAATAAGKAQAEEGAKYLRRAISLPCSFLHSGTEDRLFYWDPLPSSTTSTYCTVSVWRVGSDMGVRLKKVLILSILPGTRMRSTNCMMLWRPQMTLVSAPEAEVCRWSWWLAWAPMKH